MSATPHPYLSREDVAKLEIGRTAIRRSVAWVLAACFLLAIALVPLADALLAIHKGAIPPSLDVLPIVNRFMDALRMEKSPCVGAWLLSANHALKARLVDYENNLEDQSLPARRLIPPMQALAGVRLQAGNEKLYIGNRHGGRRWLFFRPDVDSLLAPGFLEPQTLRNRERNGDAWNPPPQPDPRVAVLEFRDQLASRGTELLLLPVPGKASIQPDRLAAGSGALAPLRNPSFDRFVKEMENAGVRVFDPSKSLMDFSLASSSPETYLATDTHWTPDAMDRVARDAASVVVGMASLSPPLVHSHRETSESLSGIGDIARMMRMSEGYTPFPPETFLLRPVITATGEYWSPTRSAEILLLGDSFSNIYSLEAMGMGRSAGFTERLGLHLRRPLDTLVRNDCGAYATRQWLARELARGNDRLEGKKLVIWQFSERELVYGDWRRIPLLWGEKRPSSFYVPPTGTVADVEGMVESLTPIPRPGSVVYADYILVVHLSGLSGGDGRMPAGAEALVYAWGMRDNKLAEASRLRVGEKTRWRIVPWSDVEEKWGGIRRGKLEEESISLQEPCWGEWIP